MISWCVKTVDGAWHATKDDRPPGINATGDKTACGMSIERTENTRRVPTCHECRVAITPVPMLLWCPACGERHVDRGAFATKPHHTHACQRCGMVWRPAIVPTTGVEFLPGFKDEVQR